MRDGAIGGLFVGMVFGLIVGFMSGAIMRSATFQAEIIERGYALYCPMNGAWAWKGECAE